MTLELQFPKWPTFGEQEKRAVEDVVRSGQLFANQKVREFEESFGKYVGTEYALGLGNATQGLHLCLAALGIGIGDEVIVTPYSWISTASCILMQNAIPIFCDIEEHTLGIDPNKIEKLITKRTKAIICVHMFGYPCKISEIKSIAKKHKLALIEDASHAHGAELNGKKIGSFGDISAFSLHQRKALSVGDGGMVCTNNDSLAEKIYKMRSFGSNELSYNYRMTEFAGALGCVRLQKLDEQNNQRRKNSTFLNKLISEKLSDFLEPLSVNPYSQTVHYANIIKITDEGTKSIDTEYLEALEGSSLPIRRTWSPLHHHPNFNPSKNNRPARGLPWEFDSYDGKMRHTRYESLSLPVVEKLCPNKILEIYVHPPCAEREMQTAFKYLQRLFKK